MEAQVPELALLADLAQEATAAMEEETEAQVPLQAPLADLVQEAMEAMEVDQSSALLAPPVPTAMLSPRPPSAAQQLSLHPHTPLAEEAT